MCAAALPVKHTNWRHLTETDRSIVGLVVKTHAKEPKLGAEAQTQEYNIPRSKSTSRASFEYRAKAPPLAQFDRDAGPRLARSQHLDSQTNLINLGPKRAERKKRPQTYGHRRRENRGDGNGSDAGSSQPKEIVNEQGKVKWKDVEKNFRDKTRLSRVRKSFLKKFYAPSTLATKNTRRKKVIEILSKVADQPFPLRPDNVTDLAVALDPTGMKAGDQSYSAEAKNLHIEGGFEWDVLPERQMATC